MKKALSLLLAVLLLTGCGSPKSEDPPPVETREPAANRHAFSAPEQFPAQAPEYISRFDSETLIQLSDRGIAVNGSGETEAVFTSRDIIYYEDRDTYPSGNPYGEGSANQRHTAEEAAAHTVVNITKPGAYRVTGKLSAGQLRIDLGEDAREDPEAVVELILEGADITCTVAPAILFLNVYECDGDRDAENATPYVDTSDAGANLILELENTVTGSHVAKIFKDKDEEKKLWKQDGAIYSYMSMNIYGPASLDLNADNEGIGTEMHLTVNGGNISIYSDNDGINTNEDGVSVTTVNGGRLWINAGLGAEGDGIDSNGYLVINGGIVSSAAKPASDAGLDSDLGSIINGGTVIALGSAMDWAENDSGQVTMNLQFAQEQQPGTSLVITDPEGAVVFAYTPETVEGLTRGYRGVILSSPNLQQGQTYCVYTGGTLDGYYGRGYLVDVTTVTGYTGGTQLEYTGSDMGMGFPGSPGGGRPTGPENFDPEAFGPGNRPERDGHEQDFDNRQPGNFPGEPPEGMVPPAKPEGEGIPGSPENRDPSTEFFLKDTVNAFSGIAPA